MPLLWLLLTSIWKFLHAALWDVHVDTGEQLHVSHWFALPVLWLTSTTHAVLRILRDHPNFSHSIP